MSIRRNFRLKRQRNGIGVVLLPPAIGSLSNAYAVIARLETDDDNAPKSIRGREFHLMLMPDDARRFAEQLIHFANQAEAAANR